MRSDHEQDENLRTQYELEFLNHLKTILNSKALMNEAIKQLEFIRGVPARSANEILTSERKEEKKPYGLSDLEWGTYFKSDGEHSTDYHPQVGDIIVTNIDEARTSMESIVKQYGFVTTENLSLRERILISAALSYAQTKFMEKYSEQQLKKLDQLDPDQAEKMLGLLKQTPKNVISQLTQEGIKKTFTSPMSYTIADELKEVIDRAIKSKKEHIDRAIKLEEMQIIEKQIYQFKTIQLIEKLQNCEKIYQELSSKPLFFKDQSIFSKIISKFEKVEQSSHRENYFSLVKILEDAFQEMRGQSGTILSGTKTPEQFVADINKHPDHHHRARMIGLLLKEVYKEVYTMHPTEKERCPCPEVKDIEIAANSAYSQVFAATRSTKKIS